MLLLLVVVITSQHNVGEILTLFCNLIFFCAPISIIFSWENLLQIKRYGFVAPNEADLEALGLTNEHYGLDVRSDVSDESNNYDAKDPLDLEGEEENKRYTQNHEYDEQGVQIKPYGYTSRDDEISEDQSSQAEPEFVPEPFNKQSGKNCYWLNSDYITLVSDSTLFTKLILYQIRYCVSQRSPEDHSWTWEPNQTRWNQLSAQWPTRG